MNKRVTIAVIAVVTLVAVAVPILYAQHSGHAAGRMHGRGMGHGPGALHMLGVLEHLKDELNLSEQQSSDIKAILAEVHEQNAASREQLHGKLKAVAQTLIANPNDVAGAQAILDQQDDTERALKTNMIKGASKALNVLTAEQRARLSTIVAEHFDRMESRR
jgi:filamentous hemagglutinin family protein